MRLILLIAFGFLANTMSAQISLNKLKSAAKAAQEVINPANLSGLSVSGTGNSGNLTTLNQQWSLGSNFNQLRITGIDNFSPIIVKAQLF